MEAQILNDEAKPSEDIMKAIAAFDSSGDIHEREANIVAPLKSSNRQT